MTTTLSEALEEAYASNPSDVVIPVIPKCYLGIENRH